MHVVAFVVATGCAIASLGVWLTGWEKRVAVCVVLVLAAVVASVTGVLGVVRSRSKATKQKTPTVCVVQYDNRPIAKLGDLAGLVDETQKRCARDETCKYFDMSQDTMPSSVPVYWAKVFAAREVAQKHPECDWVMWLDTDAHLTGLRRLGHYVESVATKANYFLYSDDGPWGGAAFNAGVWFARTDRRGRALLEEWARTYTDTASFCWTKGDDKRWACNATSERCRAGCRWAGAAYEQGAMGAILRRPLHRVGAHRVDSCSIMHDATTRDLRCRGTKPVARHFVFKKSIPLRDTQAAITRAAWQLGNVLETV